MPEARRRVAVITGGAAGIGEALSRMSASRGDRLLITDRDDAAARRLADELGADSRHLDVTDRADWDALAAELQESVGSLDRLYLNAGIGSGEIPVDVTALEWAVYDQVLRVNCDGVFGGLRALLPLLTSGGGVVVVTSSMRGVVPGPADPVYSMSKHAVIGLVRSLAPRLQELGVRIHAVCPGGTVAPDTVPLMDRPPWNTAPWQDADVVADAVDAMEHEPTGQVITVIGGVVSPVVLPQQPY